MHVDVRLTGDVVIVDLEGRLVAGDGAEFAPEIFQQLLTDGYKKILVNLTNVEHVDSLGLGVLVEAYKGCEELGGSFRLLRPQGRVEKTLRLTMLLPLFKSYESEEDALKDFG